MKKTVLIVLLLLIGMALAFPQPGYSWGHRWLVPGAFVGGALLGAAIARPAYGYPPPAPYAYPAPAYGHGYPSYGPRYYHHGYSGGRGYGYRGYGHRG